MYKNISSTPGWLAREEALTLFLLSSKLNSNDEILEIGSYAGKSTLALASNLAKVTAVDPHTGDKTEVEAGLLIDTYELLVSTLKNANVIDNVKILKMKSFESLPILSNSKFRLFFVDGWHSTEAVKIDISICLEHKTKNFTIVFDDYLYPEVSTAIENYRKLLPIKAFEVGKMQVFSNDPYILNDPYIRFIKRLNKFNRFKNYWQLGLVNKFIKI